MTQKNHFYALIMAGGGGTRLWPLSRKDRPKQVLPLTEERSMIQVTVERLGDLLPPEQIYIVAGPNLAVALQENVPSLPPENFILEPEPRNSGPAAGLGTYAIAARDPDAVIAVLSADHHIADEAAFLESLRCAENYARQGHIVTLGITPSYAATGFGYIKRSESIGSWHDLTAYRADGFHEKPDAATAATFVQSGLYSWNAGMFIWHVQTAMAEFVRQQPAMDAGLRALTQQMISLPHVDQYAATTALATWNTFPKQSIDYLLMENAQDIVVIPVEIGWSDVGTWGALFEVLTKTGDGNAVRSTSDTHIQIDTHHTLLVSNRMVVTIGVDDLVIVDTDDVLLVCHRDRAQDVRAIVEQLRAQGKAGYY